MLTNRVFSCHELRGDEWIHGGTLALFGDTARLNDEVLRNVAYTPATKSVVYSDTRAGAARAGRLNFTEDHLAFSGMMLTAAGEDVAVRGHAAPLIFDTRRKPKGSETWAPFEPFSITTEWQTAADVLVTTYKLGETDISDRTAMVESERWEWTIEMQPSSGLLGTGDSFRIRIGFGGGTFAGQYVGEDKSEWVWEGTAREEAAPAPAPEPLVFLAETFEASSGPTLSVQDLMNVSTFITRRDEEGKEVVLDTAQVETGKYFHANLCNSIPEPYRERLFGAKTEVPPRVEAIRAQYADFYGEAGVLHMGQILKSHFADEPRHKDVVAKIDAVKLKEKWDEVMKKPAYTEQAPKLYAEGYRKGVPAIQPYLDDDPARWAGKLHDRITSPQFIKMWRAQIGSDLFANSRQQLYEWYTQLALLQGGDAALGRNMLQTMFGAILHVQFERARWTDELRPFIVQALQNMAKGTVELRDEILENNDREVKQIVAEMVSQFDTVQQLADEVIVAYSAWARQPANSEAAVARGGEAVAAAIQETRPGLREKLKGFGRKVGAVFSAIAFAASAGYIISHMVQDPTLNVIEEIGLGVMAAGLLVKGVEKLMAVGIGNFLERRLNNATGALGRFASSMQKWFTAEGVVAQGWATKIFTTSSARFFAARVGPVLALFGLAMSAWELANAVQTADVTAIVFETLNVIVGLAGLVALGFELASFAWAGPAGLIIAIVGGIILLVQLIVSIAKPSQPPPDAIADFINGPLREKGCVTA